MNDIIRTDEAPILKNMPFSQAVKINGFVFVSGQLGINPKDNKLVVGFEKQVRQSMDNLLAILKAAGCDAKDIVKVTVFLDNINNFSVFNKIYQEYFDNKFPARSAFEVKGLAMSAMVEIDAIACSSKT